MTKQRKQFLIDEMRASLWTVREIWQSEAGENADNFHAFHDSVLGMGGVYFEVVELTDEERKLLNADGSADGDLKIVLEIVLGEMWLEW